MKVYKRIRELREDRDLSQSAVATAVNITQRSYSYYENGERVISPEILVNLAKFYGVSVDYILELTDNPKPCK